jgi:hypothetical protein
MLRSSPPAHRWRYVAYLKAFQDGADKAVVINDPKDFNGCGGNSDWDIDSIQFRNDAWGERWVCFDRVQLL